MTPLLREFVAELRRRVDGDVRTDEYSRVLYSTDASLYQVLPHGVLIPRSVEDVHAAVELAARHGVPLLPRTSGTSLAGQAVNEALVVDFTPHLNRILEVDREGRSVRVQPGVVLDELNAHLRPHGLWFGPDPASSNRAALGGIVSNNSTGSHSIVYGMTADHVLEMGVVLGDGSLARFGPLEADELAARRGRAGLEGAIYRGIDDLARDPANAEIVRAGTPRHWRRCGGYNLDRFVDGPSFRLPRDRRFNLAKLVCGAEGTLAVMTEIRLGLVPLPPHTVLAIVHFDSLYAALSAVPAILETGPSAVELMDHNGLTLCRDVPAYARLLRTFLDGEPDCILITEYAGDDPAALNASAAGLGEHLRRRGAGAAAVVPVTDPDRQQDVWTVRKVGLGLMMSVKGDRKPVPFIEDAAVPVEHLAEYVTRIERFCEERGTSVAYYAHASAGCLHIRPVIDTKRAAEIAKLPEITAFSVELLHGYGGALSSEHGDGRARSWINERFFGPDLYRLYREVKHTFDPKGILNPGNVVDAPPMTGNLRFGETYCADAGPPRISFAEHGDTPSGGFDRALEMCNGAGVCRQEQAGTMCPSYMVTREEEHSTRGRANALRAAISGRLPARELTSERMYRVMDLCVECKGCKAECPSAVDMAKIKLEFLARYHAEHGTPLRARWFGGIAGFARAASGTWSPLVNTLSRVSPVRFALDRLLGISRRRPLPAFAREPFPAWFARRERTRRRDGATRRAVPDGAVALFHDTFHAYQQPEVARAATELLEAAGFEVILPAHRCCGRPMISKGLVEPARAAARQTVASLAPLAEQGMPIVGLEPSCLLTLRDEYRYLLPGDRRVERIAQAAQTLEEFLARHADEGRLNLVFTDEPRQLLLHGHCHQKALVGTGPARRILGLPANYTVEEVDSGCCGMAGSFGYESEHYEISMRMAERRLFPAVRAASAATTIVAAGTSCRQQILHGTGRRARHPAEVLREALR